MNSKERIWEWECQIPRKTLPLNSLPRTEILDHPLKSVLATSKLEIRGLKTSAEDSISTMTVVSSPIINDPLMSAMDGIDPLSAMAAQAEFDEVEVKMKKNASEDKLNSWKEQRLFILNKYTTTNKISINSGIISHRDGTSQSSQTDSSKLRQEDVDDIFSKEIMMVTVQEYTEGICELSNELNKAWQQDFRVKALKIAIQSAKFLVDTTVIHFYPSKFVLITDILDVFGNLIYERLWNKADYHQEIPENLAVNSASCVSETAKETCRNWFYKIASIRELIPRIYVEAAALKSYSFLTNSEFLNALKRLITMIRGIGDPLVGVYARCYLNRVGVNLPNNNSSSYAKDNFTDFLLTYDQIFRSAIQSELIKQKIDMPTYLNSFVPAVDWLLKDAINKATEVQLDEILYRCCKKKNKGLLLNSVLSTFRRDYIALQGEFFITEISACVNDPFPLHLVIQKLGECLQERSVSNPNNIIRQMWKVISHITNLSQYLSCILAWNAFIVRYCSLNELNKFLEEIIIHIGTDVKSCYSAVQDIMIGVIKNFPEIDLIFTMDKFLPLLDLLDSDYKADTCRKMLEFIAFHPNYCNTTDPVTTNALIFVGKILHDSVNVLTVEDEKRQIGIIISKVIKKIKFTTDFEKQLAFYVDARATFINLDSVAITLIHCVNKLAIETGRKVKSHHTRKTASFVHACAAFSFITIPSIRSEHVRLQLYLVTAQIALFNQCLGQADACIKIALLLLLELPQTYEIDGKIKTNDSFMEDYVKNLLSTLVIFPDCPEQGVLYLTRGLINVLNEYTSECNVLTVTNLYLYILDLLCTAAQPDYPYHIKKVDSNDVLYGSDPKFLNEINNMCSLIVERTLENIHSMSLKNEFKEQWIFLHDLFLRIMNLSDLESQGIAKLALQIWHLVQNHEFSDLKLTEKTVAFLKKKSAFHPSNSAFATITSRIEG